MSYYYLFRKYGVCAFSQKRTLSRKNYFKVMMSSRIYRIFVILAILMMSSNFRILQFIYLHCVELLWKNQVSIINNSNVITIYILNIFPFFPFEPIFKILVSTILLLKIVKFFSYLYQAEIFTVCLDLILSYI